MWFVSFSFLSILLAWKAVRPSSSPHWLLLCLLFYMFSLLYLLYCAHKRQWMLPAILHLSKILLNLWWENYVQLRWDRLLFKRHVLLDDKWGWFFYIHFSYYCSVDQFANHKRIYWSLAPGFTNECFLWWYYLISWSWKYILYYFMWACLPYLLQLWKNILN